MREIVIQSSTTAGMDRIAEVMDDGCTVIVSASRDGTAGDRHPTYNIECSPDPVERFFFDEPDPYPPPIRARSQATYKSPKLEIRLKQKIPP